MPSLAPKVRDDLAYFDQVIDGDEVVLVGDPVRGTYFRFNPLQAAMLRALDGHRTAAQITAVLSEQFEVEIPAAAAERFITRARDLMLLEITAYQVTPRAAREQVRKALRQAGFRMRAPHPPEPPRARSDETTRARSDETTRARSDETTRARSDETTRAPSAETALRVQYPTEPTRAPSAETERFAAAFAELEQEHPRAAAGYLAEILEANPDNARAKQLYDLIQTAYIRAHGGRTDVPTWVLFNPSRLLTWLSRKIGRLLFGWIGVLAMLAVLCAGVYAYTLISFEDVSLGALDLTIAITVYVLGTLFHEIGHGLPCQHYGGNVTEIGFMLFLYIKPAAYCDTTSSYVITERRHKLIVQLGGTIASLLYIAGLSIALALLHPGLAIYPGLALALVIESALAFITLIPFIKSDGYYAICDYFNFANLRDRSFKLTRSWLSERLLGIALPTEELPPRTRRALITYAVLSIGFNVLFVYVAYVWMLAPIVARLRGAVLLAAIALAAYMLRNVVLRPVWNAARWVVRERRQIFTRRRTAVLLVLATALIGPWFLPWPVLVDAGFTVVPHHRAGVRAEVAGRVEAIFVKEGDRVRRGEPIATLRNAALHARIAALAAEAETGDAKLEAQLAQLRADEALLTLRSPIDGVVATAHLDDKRQAVLAPGERFAEVQDVSTVVAEIALSPSDPLGELAVGDDVVLRAYGAPDGEIRARVERFREAAQDGGASGNERRLVAITSPFTLERPLPGLTGHARIYGVERSLAYANLYLPLQRLVWSMW